MLVTLFSFYINNTIINDRKYGNYHSKHTYNCIQASNMSRRSWLLQV